MFRMLSALAEKDFVTLGNAASGVAGIVFASMGRLDWAFGALVAGLACDFLDGQVARSGKVKTGANELGKQLDSLSDAITFGAFPAVASFLVAPSALAAVASLVYVCAAVTRLAHFNVQSEKGVFYGMPSPIAALLVMLCAWIAPQPYLWAWVIACAAAMVAWVRIQKPFYKATH